MTTLIRICNDDSVRTAAAYLHDARFTKDDVHFDSKNDEFTLNGLNRLGNDPAWRPFILHFTNVNNADIAFSENVEYYEIGTITNKGLTIRILGHYAFEATLHTSAINGEVQFG